MKCCPPASGWAERQRARGMTLVELMVALVVGLFLAMVVSSLMVGTLRQQAISAAVNERDQAATLALGRLDLYIRSAGAGFANTWDKGFFGCALQAAKSGVALIPATPPSPFQSVSNLAAPVMAPLVVESGVGSNGSDVLFVMGGNGGYANVPRRVAQSSGDSLGLENPLGIKANDLLVVAAPGKTACYVAQVGAVTSGGSGSTEPGSAPEARRLTLSGPYYQAIQPGAESLESIASAADAIVAPLGNTAAAYPMAFLLGVGSGDVLYQYDLLQTRSSAAQAVTDGVSHLFALYGVDTDSDGRVDSWVSPGSSGWTAAEVMASPARMHQILAVRVALITRSRGVRDSNVSPATLQVFASLGSDLAREVSLSAEQRAQRFRVVESVIPLRNNLQVDP